MGRRTIGPSPIDLGASWCGCGLTEVRVCSAGADPGGGGRDPPCSRPPIFFSTNFLTIAKKQNKTKSLRIFYGRYVP